MSVSCSQLKTYMSISKMPPPPLLSPTAVLAKICCSAKRIVVVQRHIIGTNTLKLLFVSLCPG